MHNNNMIRPQFISFTALVSNKRISIQASLTRSPDNLTDQSLSTPIQSINLIRSYRFKIKILGLNGQDEKILIREYESDSFGNFKILIPETIANSKIEKLIVFETSTYKGIELHLGSFIPFKIPEYKKIIISDFDKTLCDTKYSTPKEVITSLKSPLNHFPTITKSVDLLNSYIQKDFNPFILSASPHFYRNAIRNWLYQNKIFVGDILLKDYRTIFSLTQGVLTPKDVSNQGFYKLNQIVTILSMTGVPNELVLMGDAFEKDSFIYLIIVAILKDKVDPWYVWNQIKTQKAFQLTTKQTSHFLNQFYQLSEQAKKLESINISVYIRCNEKIYQKSIDSNFTFGFLQKNKDMIKYYQA